MELWNTQKEIDLAEKGLEQLKKDAILKEKYYDYYEDYPDYDIGREVKESEERIILSKQKLGII